MQIFIGADHRGFALKEQLKEWLVTEHFQVQVEDCGAADLDPEDDFPVYAFAVAEKVAAESEVAPQADDARGILLCGSGVGVCVAANKVKGIRCGCAGDEGSAARARRDDNINILALAANDLSFDQAQKIILAFLQTPFSTEPKYQRRLDQIAFYERSHITAPLQPPKEV